MTGPKGGPHNDVFRKEDSMYLAKRQKFDWPFVLGLGDAVALLVSMVVTRFYFQHFPTAEGSSFFLLHGFGKVVLYAVLVVFFLQRSSLYSWTAFTSRFFRPRRLLRALVSAAATFVAIAAIFGESRNVVVVIMLWISVQTISAALFMWVARLLLRILMMDVWRLIPLEKIAFVGWSPAMKRVLMQYRHEVGRFQSIAGYFESGSEGAFQSGLPSLGPLSQIEQAGSDLGITLLIADENALTPDQLKELVLASSRASIHFRMIPASFDVLSRRLSTRIVAGIPLIGIHGVPLDFFANRVVKRVVDVAGALLGLAISAPIIAVMAVLVWSESPGPLFYRQVRMGKGGRLFDIIKIRSMKLDAEAAAGAQWAVENDPRRLRIGAFMRRWNIDETPQFWNVLRGEMSLVGPRPERPEFVEVFNHDVNHYNLRHHCRPGLTSWAAIHGLRGNTSITERLDYDLYYYENWSLVLDFQILFRTLLPPKNAY